MNQVKRKKLQQAGFRVGSVKEFLGLSAEEMPLIDLKVDLIKILRPAGKSKTHGK